MRACAPLELGMRACARGGALLPAESFHRDFFKNWAMGVPPEKCSRGTEGHNTASIGGFVMLPPIILGTLPRGLAAAKEAALKHLALTHESSMLAKYAEVGGQGLQQWWAAPEVTMGPGHDFASVVVSSKQECHAHERAWASCVGLFWRATCSL
jgi:hypothetical protein